MSGIFRAKAPYIFAVAIAFILFQSFILLNSFPAIYRIYTIIQSSIEIIDPFWTLFWFFSELFGEIGLIVRFVGACLFVAFAWILLRRKEFSLSVFRRAILLEGIHFLFYIPFIAYLFARPTNTTAALITYRETAISYTIQTILVFSSLIVLYIKTRRLKIETVQLLKWGAIAVVNYIFALWIKHFLFNLYALPIDVVNPVLLVGLLNSTLTMLIAAIILFFASMPVIRGKITSFNSRVVGSTFILIGVYFIIYILVALVDSGYLAFLPLTELWAISFSILGVGFLIERSS